MSVSVRRFVRHAGLAAGVLLRGGRAADLGLVVAVSLAVGVSTFGWSWSVDARRDALSDRLATAGPSASAVLVRYSDGVDVDAGPSPFSPAITEIDAAAGRFPDGLTDLLDEADLVVDTNAFTIEAIDDQPLATPSTLNFRVQQGLEERSTLVEGRRPRPTAGDGVVEVAVSVGTAAELAVGVEDVIAVSLDLDDPLTSRLQGFPRPFEVVVAGIVELDDVDDPFWFGDARLHRPIVDDTPLGAERRAFVAVSEAAVAPSAPFVAAGSVPVAVEWRTRIDLDRVTPSNDATIRAAITEVEATTTRTANAGSTAVLIGLADTLADSTSERAAAVEVSWLVIAPWALAGLSALGELNLRRLVHRRRRLELLVRRGVGRRALLAGAASSTLAVAAAGLLIGSTVGVVASSVVGFDVASLRTLVGLAAMVAVVLVVATVLHTATMFRTARALLPGGLLVGRLDDRPPRWGRIGALGTAVVVIGWLAAVALLWRTDVRVVDPLVVIVVIGLPVVSGLVTHQRIGRAARWPAVAAGAASVAAAVTAVTRDWVPATDGVTAIDLSSDVRGQLLLWGASAAVAAAAIVVVRLVRPAPGDPDAPGRGHSLDAFAASCVVVVVGIAAVGTTFLARVDVVGAGRALEGPRLGGFVAASTVAAVLVLVAFAARGSSDRRPGRPIDRPDDFSLSGDRP